MGPTPQEETGVSDILIRNDDAITVIALNRVPKKNSITSAMYAQLAQALGAAARDPAVRCVLIHGHETIFSAGNDIGDFLNDPPNADDAPVFQFVTAVATFAKPLVAAVCGPAVGIGTTMLMHCDLVYAGENARFSMPFVNLGLCPEAASSLLVPVRFGWQRAAQMLLLGESIDAAQALDWGLVNRVLEPSQVLDQALASARTLASKPLASLIETKRLMKAASISAINTAMADEAVSFRRMLREPAAIEAFSAFTERRKPDFSRF
jgi:enoyl-CoA hydratase/carnithine racemase